MPAGLTRVLISIPDPANRLEQDEFNRWLLEVIFNGLQWQASKSAGRKWLEVMAAPAQNQQRLLTAMRANLESPMIGVDIRIEEVE